MPRKHFQPHSIPAPTDEAMSDALFHYTSADGMMGILQSGSLWSTAYYCSNDETELEAGKGVLTPEFQKFTQKLIDSDDPLALLFKSRGIDPLREYADRFEQIILDSAKVNVNTYISCFCKPNSVEDFLHGLLSQWRGYGPDGGYALQFSRSKLEAIVDEANKHKGLRYQLRDVLYTSENEFSLNVRKRSEEFVSAYKGFLRMLVVIPKSQEEYGKWRENLSGDALGALMDYSAYTKNSHFSEEKECRLSIICQSYPIEEILPTFYFNRRGLVVPYKKTPADLMPILDSISWIVVGPSPRMDARMRSLREMIRSLGLKIKVRPSEIPFVRE